MRHRRKTALVVFTYLVTKDLAETLRQKIGIPIREETSRRVSELEEEFLTEFWQYIPAGINWTSLCAKTISAQLEKAARKKGLPVVSMDRVYLPQADAFFEATRLTDCPVSDFSTGPDYNGDISISNRYGTPPLLEQADGLRKLSPIILADVGAYSGDTLLQVCKIIECQGVDIEEIYLGITSIPTLDRMKNNRPCAASSIRALDRMNKKRQVYACNTFSLFEWIELRDLFGIDGRACTDQGGTREFIPYWEKLNSWASIPFENIAEVKKICESYNQRLLDLIARDNETSKNDLERAIGRKAWCYRELFEMKTIDESDLEEPGVNMRGDAP